uniref:Ubiquitinyl hydrolase 1 n=1 Tax=Caenorhabditis japonica TaxID=281687 RepID=A0A8R1HMG9_CAEJA
MQLAMMTIPTNFHLVEQAHLNTIIVKICTEGIDLWVQSTSESSMAPDITTQYQENHDMLVNMGFNSDEIDSALRMSNNDVEKAVQFLTREIIGLDAATKPTSSNVDKMPKANFGLPELLRPAFVDSDEEELSEENRLNWDDEVMIRIKTILEQKPFFVIFHKNGSIHRRIQCAKNLIEEKNHEKKIEALNFVDEFISFLIGRHVNCSDPPYIGNPEAHAIEDFFVAVTPLLCVRLINAPSSVKSVLAIDEMFNWRNKFFVQGAQYLDTLDREFPPLKYIDIERLERLDHKRAYAYLSDIFVEQFIPRIDERMELVNDEGVFEISILDLQCIFRTLNIFSPFMVRGNDVFLCKLETWISKTLDRFRIVNDKEIRDALCRRQGLDLLNEVVLLCDRFGLDVATTTQEARLDYLQKWIKCSQMESILHALEELGTIADRFHRTGGMTITRPKSHVNEDYFKLWLEDNKVLQIVLTGNMDHVVYVERIQPILQYMTPELTFDDMKFVWSLRKGRMGVSVDNFNKIMEFISKSVNNEQIEWLIELFKKSFRSRETRLYEPIFNFCTTIAMQKDRDDECKLKISNIIWELIHIARGPPRCASFKAIEYGMKKHCDLLNLMYEKNERDTFLSNMMDALNTDDGFNEITIVYLFIMLEKLKRIFTPKRSFAGDESLSRVNELRGHLRDRRLSEPILDRLERIRQMAHERYAAVQNANTDSQSNAVFESTSDAFGGNQDNILMTTLFGCTDYAFVLQNTLRLLKWLHDIDASIVDVDYVQRLFSIFIERPDATPQEKTEVFAFLFEIKMALIRPETSRAVITHLCGMDMCNLQITGLRCFCKYWEELPILSNEESRPVESFIVNKDNECKLFVWKLILFNQYDDVVEKSMETFCERDLVLVDSPYSVRHHTYSFLSVFSFYVEKLKGELYERSNKENLPITYDQTELAMSEEEIRQHDVPLDAMLTETIARALNRLIRFMTRFVELGNEKNHMIRENPCHGSSISGHSVSYSIELKNDDDDIDCDLNQWKNLVCDSSTTIGEFKVRLAKRLFFHEGINDFSVHKREEDLTMGEANLRYDFLTLQNVKLASETDSIFLSEKLRILIKPNPYRKSSSRRSDLQNQQFHQKKALREDFLPMSIISKCNFYDLLHELASNGDKHIRASVRRLLLLLPTEPSLIKQLTFGELDDDEDEPLTAKVKNMYTDYITPSEPSRMLYALEAISSVVAPTRLTSQACEDASELTNALLEVGIFKSLTDDILNKPHVIPLTKCSPTDRHSIFERVIQILRSCLVGNNSYIKMIRNEYRIREEMRKTCERMMQSRQTPRPIDPCMDYALIRQQIMPPPCVDNQNNPAYSTIASISTFKTTYNKLIENSLHRWSLDDLISFFECIRNFQWIHVATESLVSKPIVAFLYDSQEPDPLKPTASEIIRSIVKGDRFYSGGDECRLIIVKKAFSLIRHMVRKWINVHKSLAIELLEVLFLDPSWVRFYQDVLVNSQQEAYRKYGQEHCVKISKDSYEVTMASLQMLLDMFIALPLHEGHTAELDELQRRQRQHCDGVVQTVCEIFYFDSPRRCREEQKEIDWDQIGNEPIEIVRDQIRSLLDYKPKFSTTNNELHTTETVYAAAKMRMINCLLSYCSQSDIEDCSDEFLFAIINDFLFPELPDIEDSMFEEESIRWEYSAREAAIQTLNTFCERSYKNMHQLLLMWNKFPIAQRPYDPTYRPIIRGRQLDRVGLKNDGGTCYMNATIQQLVHVPGLAKELISIQNIDSTLCWGDNTAALLVELQRVFAQLNFSRCQAIVPFGLWREFRFEPDMPLNTKQHHDAIDFYSILLDKCDNVLKKLELPPLFQNRFFGKYSYEKICYGCWHRYKSPDEEFNCISLALSGDNLEEAIENFLAAHVMEGENAYYCEKCDEKKTTLNRSSFMELPSTMTIQLKRFTYDLVNNMIRKDNQYFKFPFEIDMTPYMTTSRHVPDEQVQDLFDEMLYGSIVNDEPATPPHKNGSAKSPFTSGSASNPSLESPQKKMFRRHRSSTIRLSQSFANTGCLDDPPQQKPLIYELVGVLAHSGIATAGHYYSFIKERREEYRDSPTFGKWYHVNDMTVSPMLLSNVEELWYGGTFTQEGVFLGIDERIRHWNAYVLFYEKKADECDMLIPRHIIDHSEEAKPKVTFDVSDELIDDGKDKEAEEAFKRDLTEARRLRISMFNSLDDNLKKFLNDENCKFLEDRDFFSFDLYFIYINSLLPLMKREDTVEYTVDELSRPDFFKLAFEYIASYIIRVAWMMFDDHRPKNFPRAATDLIKMLLHSHPDNKLYFFKALEANNSEMLTRMLESTEHDIRNSFWLCMKFALRQWVVENGRKDENIIEASPDSTDLDDDDEEEDEEDDEDEDLEDEDSECDELIGHDLMRPTPIAIVTQLMHQARPPQLKPMLPVDLSKARNSRLNIVRRIVQVLPFRVHRMEGSGRHYSRHPVDILYMIARLNEFGKSVLYCCQALPTVAEFLFEDYSTVFCRLRFPEDRLKGLGLWPALPGLYFELVLDTLNRNVQHIVDPLMHFRHALLTPAGRFSTEVMVLYCASRDECENSDNKSVDDEKAMHNRIVMCYLRQIELLTRSDVQDTTEEYIFQVCQQILKKYFKDTPYLAVNPDHWSHIMEFFNDLALRLVQHGMASFAISLLKNLLWVGVAEDDDAVQPGLLPVMMKWKEHDPHRFRKMREAMFCIRRMKEPHILQLLRRCQKRFSGVFPLIHIEDEITSDELMEEGEEDEEDDEEKVMIGPQPLKRANNLVDLNKKSRKETASATVTATEMKEIDLKEDLKAGDVKLEDDTLPLIDQLGVAKSGGASTGSCSVEEIFDDIPEDVSMMALSDEPSMEEEEKKTVDE